MRTGRTHRAMDQRPLAVDPMRKQRSIFVFGRHNHAQAFELAEILGKRQRDTRTVTRVGRIDDGVFLALLDVSAAWILSPHNSSGKFMGSAANVGRESICQLSMPLTERA